MNSKELDKKLSMIKQNKNSAVLKLLEDLGIKYRVLDSEEYGYFRVRVVVDSNVENYVYTDIWYSRFDNGWKVMDYWKDLGLKR